MTEPLINKILRL